MNDADDYYDIGTNGYVMFYKYNTSTARSFYYVSDYIDFFTANPESNRLIGQRDGNEGSSDRNMPVMKITYLENTAAAIKSAQSMTDNSAEMYSLNGQRITAPAKGDIVIRGGKKIMVR